MAIRDDFKNYWDGNGLLAPNPVVPGTLKGSDNGTMYSAEYYIMLHKSGQLTPQDLIDFQQKIGQCVDSKGILNRVPIGQDDGQDQVDNYYGTLNGCMQVGNTVIPRQFLTALIKNLGSMDNENPGAWQWVAFMPRQPQLMASVIAACFPERFNPLHMLLRALFFPLFVYSAIIVATSCWGTDPSDTDSRRLSWHLWQCTAKVSVLNWLASKIWLWRLNKAYGPTGMQAVAAIYYQPQPNNPFAKYWITE